MTGIISVYALLLAAGQIGTPPLGPTASPFPAASAPSSVTGLSDGWKLDERDGKLSYIVQLSPTTATEISTRGEEVRIDIPENLQGIAQNVVIRIGNGPVERELTDDQLKARQRARVPGISNLNSLSDRAPGGVVMIDPQRTEAPILSTGNTTSSTRSTVNDLAVQTPFSSNPSLGLGSARSGLPPSETLPPSTPAALPSTFPQSNFANSNNISNSNGPFLNSNPPSTSPFGTQPPPYTGGVRNVEGVSANDRTQIPSFGSSTFTNNSFPTTGFGGGSIYPPSNGIGPQERYAQQNGIGSPSLYNSNQPTAFYPPGQTPMPSLGNNFGTNNSWGNSSINQPNSSFVNSGQPGFSSDTPNGNLNRYSRVAQTRTPFKPSDNQNDENVDEYGNIVLKPKTTSLNAALQLLLVVSLVVNGYLLLQLSNLFNSYRALQLSKRAEGSYGFDAN